MANTLYDLLEVSQSASSEAITASYRRLHAALSRTADSNDQDATNRLIALREAYDVLSNPGQRERYDQRLHARQNDPAIATEVDSARLWPKLLLLAGLLGLCGVGYSKYQSDQERARLERERIALSEKRLQAAVEQERKREEQLAAERADAQRRHDETMERRQRERDMAYSRQVSLDLERSAEQLRREQEREQRQRADAERQRRYETEQRLAREKAYLRQLEAENSRYRRY